MKLLGCDRCETQENRGSDYFVVMFKMKTLIAIVLLIGLGGCVDIGTQNKRLIKGAKNRAKKTGLLRYENSEVICFRALWVDGIWCKWKADIK